MKGFLLSLWEILKIFLIALIIVIPIRYFLFQPFFVKGQSMEPSFENGDYLIIDELSYRLGDPQRGDVVVFRYPNDVSQRYIKRVIGLPGETVEVKNGNVAITNSEGEKVLDESLYLSGVETPGDIITTLAEEEYFVLGDNRPSSFDSRSWGILPGKDIIGKVAVRAWPFTDFTKIESPSY